MCREYKEILLLFLFLISAARQNHMGACLLLVTRSGPQGSDVTSLRNSRGTSVQTESETTALVTVRQCIGEDTDVSALKRWNLQCWTYLRVKESPLHLHEQETNEFRDFKINSVETKK